MEFEKESITQMTHDQLFAALKKCGLNAGPITSTTRSVYEKRLRAYLESLGANTVTTVAPIATPDRGDLHQEVVPPVVSTKKHVEKTAELRIEPLPTRRHSVRETANSRVTPVIEPTAASTEIITVTSKIPVPASVTTSSSRSSIHIVKSTTNGVSENGTASVAINNYMNGGSYADNNGTTTAKPTHLINGNKQLHERVIEAQPTRSKTFTSSQLSDDLNSFRSKIASATHNTPSTTTYSSQTYREENIPIVADKFAERLNSYGLASSLTSTAPVVTLSSFSNDHSPTTPTKAIISRRTANVNLQHTPAAKQIGSGSTPTVNAMQKKKSSSFVNWSYLFGLAALSAVIFYFTVNIQEQFFNKN